MLLTLLNMEFVSCSAPELSMSLRASPNRGLSTTVWCLIMKTRDRVKPGTYHASIGRVIP